MYKLDNETDQCLTHLQVMLVGSIVSYLEQCLYIYIYIIGIILKRFYDSDNVYMCKVVSIW